MRALVQRVESASVEVAGSVVGSCGRGLLVLLGVGPGDDRRVAERLWHKVRALRIFADEEGKTNRSLVDVGGGVLVVSQFTLFASTRKGTRPSFNAAAAPELANSLYQDFVRQLETLLGRPVPTGRFGAMMQVALVNDGPVTLLIDTKTRE